MQNLSVPLKPTWLPPPQPPACLIRAYASRPDQKGGTLIAKDVLDLETHRRHLCNPDGYRLDACPRCGWAGLHRHDCRERQIRGCSQVPVRRFRCSQPDCRATWQVLPEFVPRYLWCTWARIEQASMPVQHEPRAPPASASQSSQPAPAPIGSPPVTLGSPPQTAGGAAQTDRLCEAGSPRLIRVGQRTVRRWRARLASSAQHLVALLAAAGSSVLDRLAAALGLEATRKQLVLAYTGARQVPAGCSLAALAEHVHRLAPGMRVM